MPTVAPFVDGPLTLAGVLPYAQIFIGILGVLAVLWVGLYALDGLLRSGIRVFREMNRR